MKYEGTSILLPAMDETYSLQQTVDIIYQTCNRGDITEYIIILCSRTTKECRKIAQEIVDRYGKEVNIYIYDQIKPFVGGAVSEGFELARGSHVVLMSADLETDPHLVCRFIELSKSDPDKIITASRWISGGGFSNYSKIKLLCNRIFEKTIAIFFGVRLTDLTYAYRIFPGDLVKGIQWEESKHPFFLETALKPIRLGVDFIEIPAQWKARTEGCSNNSFFENFKYFRTAWHVRFMKKEHIKKIKEINGNE